MYLLQISLLEKESKGRDWYELDQFLGPADGGAEGGSLQAPTAGSQSAHRKPGVNYVPYGTYSSHHVEDLEPFDANQDSEKDVDRDVDKNWL